MSSGMQEGVVSSDIDRNLPDFGVPRSPQFDSNRTVLLSDAATAFRAAMAGGRYIEMQIPEVVSRDAAHRPGRRCIRSSFPMNSCRRHMRADLPRTTGVERNRRSSEAWDGENSCPGQGIPIQRTTAREKTVASTVSAPKL